MPPVKLRSSDNEIFYIDAEIAKKSPTIKTILEDWDMENDKRAVVPLPKVRSPVLTKVLSWLHHHKNDDQTVGELTPWDVEYLNIGQAELLELALAANYLNIKGLLKISCVAVAKTLKAESSAELLRTFED